MTCNILTSPSNMCLKIISRGFKSEYMFILTLNLYKHPLTPGLSMETIYSTIDLLCYICE